MSTADHPPQYSAASITVLSLPECVRRRPGMFAGLPDDPKTVNRLLYEALSVSLEAAARGTCTRIDLALRRDGSATVADDGPGVPMRPMRDGQSEAQAMMTQLWCGSEVARFTQTPYGGGDWAVVNALSEWCVLTTSHEGYWWTQQYRQGVPTEPFQRESATAETGLRLSFKPDATILRHTEFDAASVGPWLFAQEVRLRSTEFVLTDERHGTITHLR